MNYSLLKKIIRGTLIGSTFFFLNTKEIIAPKADYIPIKQPEVLKEDTRKIVILDPGHGMENRAKDLMDWGKSYLKYKEAEIVLEKSKKIKEMLDSTIYKVILTRNNNETSCPIESRSEIANKNNADLFISIHVNDFENWKSISGSEIYYRKDNKKELKNKSKELAKLAAKNLEDISKIPNRAVITENYLVLKGIKCPAALVELGYLLNEQDRDKILNTDKVEKAIAKTIEDYLK